MLADRNALLGIWAVQLNLISAEQVSAARQSWLQQPAADFAELLESTGGLSATDRQLLDTVVRRQLAQHGNDPERALAAALGALHPDQASRLKQVIDREIHSTISLASETFDFDPAGIPTKSQSAPSTQPSGSASRFRNLRFHAAGGLGQVSIAHDAELDREVALKEIKPQFVQQPAARSRFVLEAKVTGGLEHPGIVPVYSLGAFADGRPFYAMRFIEGETLKDAILRFHDPERKKLRSESENTLELRQLLGRFIAVCQAVEYAHSRQVLHRDLKPGNIMLGKFGQTWVVDWGLAKADQNTQDAAVALTKNPSPLAGSDSNTESGQILGSLAYMSPEQFAGAPDLGPAADVFSLGATLYHLLIGQTPYQHLSQEELYTAIKQAAIRPPRQLNRSLPKPLEAICLRALAANPADRYRTAQALLDDLERYLADEPVSAYREPLLVRARRWTRKRPGLVSGTAAAVGVAIVGLLMGTIVLSQKNHQLALANEAEVQQRQRAEREEKTAKENERKAREQEAISTAVKNFLLHDLLELAEPESQAQAQLEVDANLKVRDLMARGTQKVDKKFATAPAVAKNLRELLSTPFDPALTVRSLLLRSASKLDGKFPDQPQIEFDLRWATANALMAQGAPQAAIGHYTRCRELAAQLFRPDDRRSIVLTGNLASAYDETGESRQAIELYEQTLQRLTDKLGPTNVETIQALGNLAAAYHYAGRLPESAALNERAYRLMKEELGADHPETLKIMSNLATAYFYLGQREKGRKLHEETHFLRSAALGADHPQTLLSLYYLAEATAEVGDYAAAETMLEEAVSGMKKQFGETHPQTLHAQTSLASVYMLANKRRQAGELFTALLPIAKESLGPEHPVTLRVMNNLANLYYFADRSDLGLPLQQDLLKIRIARQGKRHPDTLQSMNVLALILLDLQRWEEALAQLEEALPLELELLGPRHPDTIRAMLYLGRAHLALEHWPQAEENLTKVWQASRTLPPQIRLDFERDTALEMVKLYTAWEKPELAEEWKQKVGSRQGD